ncbi:PASTA domain-containing protein [Geopsychrobacter electrodiphilus]|uniref:PASTA domain-containing protein n=1 Tax=Geopsychrobacter electrodiphilus TaxID=225196 RepID=UPI000374EED8|nr:PASTA domain-containing protein [Geopsychrobacter electrodiphilus]
MKTYPTLCVRVFAVSVLMLLVAGNAFSGTLDRGAMQERYNGSAKDMLRVPGVVGTYEQNALNLLQQSGLAVKIKRITEDLPKYAGKEGMVISQAPLSGGIAMIGSTVTVTVYKKNDGYDGGYSTPFIGTGAGTEPPADSWGGGESYSGSGTTGTEPTYDGSWPSDSSGGSWPPTEPGATEGEGGVPAPGADGSSGY